MRCTPHFPHGTHPDPGGAGQHFVSKNVLINSLPVDLINTQMGHTSNSKEVDKYFFLGRKLINAYTLRGAVVTLRHEGAGTDHPTV